MNGTVEGQAKLGNPAQGTEGREDRRHWAAFTGASHCSQLQWCVVQAATVATNYVPL